MDPDVVLEVLDTPERLMRVKAASSSSQHNADHSEHIYRRHHNPVGLKSNGISPHDTEELFKRAKLALSISDAPQPSTTLKVRNNGVLTKGKESMKVVNSHDNLLNTSYVTRHKGARGNPGKEPTDGDIELLGHHRSCELGSSAPASSVGRCQSQSGIELSQTESVVLQDKTYVNSKPKDKGKGTQCCNDLQPKSQHSSRTSHTTWRPTGRRLVHNGVISPCSTEYMLQDEHGIAPSATRPSSSLVELNDLDDSRETDLSAARPRNRENRQILHNDNAHYRRKSRQDKVGNVVLPGVADRINAISHERGNAGDICNGKYDYIKKGKAVVDYNVGNEQRGKIALHSRRTHRRTETDMTVSGGTSGQTSTAEDPDHRAHNLTGKPSSFSSSGAFGNNKTKDVPNRKLGSRSGSGIVLDHSRSIILPESNPNAERSISEIGSESRRKISIKGKRKCNSALDSTAQKSNSDFEDSEILYMGTSQHASNSRSSRSRSHQHSGIVLGPIIEVDELPSPVAICSDFPLGSPEVSRNTNARARQVESDEILARWLQEQIYNELPEIRSSDEIDAILALSLQEESTQHASSTSRQSHHDRRERFVARLHSQLASRNARYRPSTGNTRLMRDIDLQGMDMDTRLNLFEELELAFDNSNTAAFSHIFQVQRDFNENDYEALLALDDNNHQHLGASEFQINNLPQSVMQTDIVEEPCAICLENPSVGDIIRHLPCLHKFHKDCIDQWLRRKISCPIWAKTTFGF